MSEFEDGYRLISGRSQDRNLLPVSNPSVALQKLLVITKRRLKHSKIPYSSVVERRKTP